MGSLYLRTRLGSRGTETDEVRFTAPFKLTSPFRSGTAAEYMMMQASAGLLKGDRHELRFDIARGTAAVVTEQTYTKIFRTDGGYASRRTVINIGEGAALYYLPLPAIPFGGSSFRAVTEIDLARGSKLVYRDILACGRVGMGERFSFDEYRSSLRVRAEGRLVYAETTRLIPSEHDLASLGCFEGHTHIGTSYFYGFDDELSFSERTGIVAAVTSPAGGRLVRALANSGDELMRYFDSILSPNFFTKTIDNSPLP